MRALRWPRLSSTGFILVALLIASAMLSSSRTEPAEGAGSIVLVSDSGCTLRAGPGSLNQNCIFVAGSGLRVRTVKGYIQATYWPAIPVTVCDISVEITIRDLSERVLYSRTGVAAGCSLLSRGITATLNRDFPHASKVCSRTQWGTFGWSPPACVRVWR